MKQEEKDLLMKDLCSRLQYGVMVKIKSRYEDIFFDIKLNGYHLFQGPYNIEDMGMRPYLRPMSSMTEEEKETYQMFFNEDGLLNTSVDTYVDWLLEGHFDFRGLIPKGLALEAPKDMYN